MQTIRLDNISFPVFRLAAGMPTTQDGVSFFLYGRDIQSEDAEYKVAVVDDKNRKEPTLALRRLAMKTEGIHLYPIKTGIFFLADLIKLAKKGTVFIDKEGNIFEYEKSQWVNLIFKPISKIVPNNVGGAIIEVKGLPFRFKTLHAPTQDQTHAGLLVYGNSYILYGLYDQKYDDTKRLI